MKKTVGNICMQLDINNGKIKLLTPGNGEIENVTRIDRQKNDLLYNKYW